jgi:hypothetical protein
MTARNCEDCGKLFSSRQSLFGHKKICKKRVIITEPIEHNYPQIEYDYPEQQSTIDESEQEPAFNPIAPPSINVPYFNQANEKKPIFTSPNNRFSPKPIDLTFNNNNSNINTNDDFDSCEHLQQQIEQLLLNDDLENAELTGKLVLEDRKLYELFVNERLPVLINRQEQLFHRRKELEREMAITPNQIEFIETELSNAVTIRDLDKLVKFHRFTSEYLLYEMKFNDRFVKEIHALKIMKDNVESFRNLNIKRDFIQSPLQIKKVNEMLQTNEKKIHRQLILQGGSIILVVLIAFLVMLSFSWIQLIEMIAISLFVFLFLKYKNEFV